MFSIIQIHIYYMFSCICRVCVINIASWNLTIWSRMCDFVCMVKVQTQEIKLCNYLLSLQRYHMELEKKTRWYLNKRDNKKRKQQYTTIKAHGVSIVPCVFIAFIKFVYKHDVVVGTRQAKLFTTFSGLLCSLKNHSCLYIFY